MLIIDKFYFTMDMIVSILCGVNDFVTESIPCKNDYEDPQS